VLARISAVGDFLFGPLNLCFEFVADFKLVFDEIVQLIADRLQFLKRQAFERRLDLFDRTHSPKIADFGVRSRTGISRGKQTLGSFRPPRNAIRQNRSLPERLGRGMFGRGIIRKALLLIPLPNIPLPIPTFPCTILALVAALLRCASKPPWRAPKSRAGKRDRA
jgi:hypothetical protein